MTTSWEFPEYPENWEEIKETTKKRDGYRCVKCGSQINLHVHHKKSLNNGGKNSLKNLVTLCEQCHNSEHNHYFHIQKKYEWGACQTENCPNFKKVANYTKGVCKICGNIVEVLPRPSKRSK